MPAFVSFVRELETSRSCARVHIPALASYTPLDDFASLLKIYHANADTKGVDTPHSASVTFGMDESHHDTLPLPIQHVTAYVGAAARSHATSETRWLGRVARIAALVAIDVAALTCAALAGYVLWALPAKGQSLAVYAPLVPLLAVFVVGYAQAGLYPGLGLGPVETLRRLSMVTAFGFLLTAAFSFALKAPALYSRVAFLIALGLSLVFVPLARAAATQVAHQWSWWSEPVVVVGTWDRAARVIAGMRQASLSGYRAVAVLAVGPTESAAQSRVEGVPVLGGIDDAAAIAATGVHVALVETRRADPARERPMIDSLQRHFRRVVLVREYDDLPVEGLQIRNLGRLVGIEYTNNLLRHSNHAIKRFLDLVIGSLALLAAAPVIAVGAALVRLLDGGPSFFVQERTGMDGRRIAVPKIRTMRRNADTRLRDYLAANPTANMEWESRFKLREDPRLIPIIGGLFRRYSVDELPQLWTVLRGDMSLVGPRPFPDYHLETFSPGFLELRLRVRPGITGLWQITIRSAGTTRDQESFDSYYIRNWSVWLDLYILSRTIAAVVSGRGAF
jgi:Undecaprenyl-phosphate galactose phosphotransferase WbaP